MMDQAIDVLLKQGGWAAALFILSLFVIRSMWNRMNMLQDKRLDEALKFAEITNKNTVAIEALTASIQALGELIRNRTL